MRALDLIASILNLHLFFFNDTATTEIYTLSLHDALPISLLRLAHGFGQAAAGHGDLEAAGAVGADKRSEEHTSELQSQFHLVCRLLLEKKKNQKTNLSIVTQKQQNK